MTMDGATRSRPPRRGAAIAALAVSLSAGGLMTPAPAGATRIEVAVTGVGEARGHVRVELCTRQTFLTSDCPYAGLAPAVAGSTVVTVEAPPGEYAVQAFQDDTDQGVIHRNLLGLPRERIGFSNDAPLHVSGPRFKDAAFSVGAEVSRITLRLRRLFGGSK
jgi:uncharacterized protein (DUF2141 family)